VVERLKDLTDEESIDYIRSIQTVHKFIEHIYKADSLNIAIQDGPEAGQSIPHLHTHIIPRHKMNNIGDEIYERMDSSKYDIDESLRDFYDRKTVKQVQKFVVKPDSDRLGRSDEEMHKEAAWLAQEFEKYIQK
jgi:bis(5'-adenosyl)-triphosphatase